MPIEYASEALCTEHIPHETPLGLLARRLVYPFQPWAKLRWRPGVRNRLIRARGAGTYLTFAGEALVPAQRGRPGHTLVLAVDLSGDVHYAVAPKGAERAQWGTEVSNHNSYLTVVGSLKS